MDIRGGVGWMGGGGGGCGVNGIDKIKKPFRRNSLDFFWQTKFCKAARTTWKLTFQDINTTPKEPKTERGRSRRQL